MSLPSKYSSVLTQSNPLRLKNFIALALRRTARAIRCGTCCLFSWPSASSTSALATPRPRHFGSTQTISSVASACVPVTSMLPT